MYITLAVAGTGWGLITLSENHQRGAEFLELVNGFQATFGLMLVSLTAPTVLAEERVRGSLDVLLATPLSTDRIVLAKWWGIYRVVPALALLPAIGAVFIAAERTDLPATPHGTSRWVLSHPLERHRPDRTCLSADGDAAGAGGGGYQRWPGAGDLDSTASAAPWP